MSLIFIFVVFNYLFWAIPFLILPKVKKLLSKSPNFSCEIFQLFSSHSLAGVTMPKPTLTLLPRPM